MSLSALFITRPIGTTLLALGIAIAGIVAFKLLPVAAIPQIEFPTISVQASLPGASPNTMATSVATPLERQLGHIAGITEMTSSSTLGATTVTVQFDLSRDIDGAARDVQAAINAARTYLPVDLPSNPTYRKVNPADSPVLIIALTSKVFTRGQIYDVASTVLQQKLSQINGVGQVIVGGSSLPAVRVELDPTSLNKYAIPLEVVRGQLANANVNHPKGQLTNGPVTSEIYTNDQIFRAVQYRPLIIVYQNNSPVRLSDIAQVNDSVEDIRNIGLFNGKPAVLLVIFKQPGANVIATVDKVRAMMPILKASISPNIDMDIMMDRTTTVRASLLDVEITLVAAVILVILVVYFFLGNARAALIPSVAVPLSLLGTFGVMVLLGYSLNNLSLVALTISTGFVIDDAVVVLENISRHIESGLQPLRAAFLGVKEVSFTVVSMSASLIAVFIPLLLMGSIVGRLFREFSVTLSTAILVSLVISLTVTPMMCAHLLKKETKENKGFHFIERMNASYEKSLAWALRHQRFMLLLLLLAIVLNVFLFIVSPKGFFPQQDTGRIMGSIQAQQSISFQAMQQKLIAFVNIVKNDPAVQDVVGFVGGQGSTNSTSNSGRVFITLKPLAQRSSADDVISRLREKFKKIVGANLYLQSAQDLVIGGRLGNAQFQYTLASDNLSVVNQWAPRVLAQLTKIPQIADVNSDQQDKGLQSFVTIDRDTASRVGMSMQQIDQTLYDAFGQRQVSVMYTPMNQYHVVMEVAPQFWQHPETLNDIYLQNSSSGLMVPLSVFAKFAPSDTLLSVNHQDQFPSATLSFNLRSDVALGDAVNLVSQAVTKMHWPANLRGSFKGTAQAFQAALVTEPYLIAAALIAVYIVLGILYESLIHPITILSTLPSAGVGALLALLIFRVDLSIMALIGIILLIGIVKKNAIMMIDFALIAERTENKTPEEAIYQAALLRFRPIMMTTFAAMLGALPLALNYGVGSELRRPLGIAIIGGLLISQMLTLYTTPVIYLKLERFNNWMKGLNMSPFRWMKE